MTKNTTKTHTEDNRKTLFENSLLTNICRGIGSQTEELQIEQLQPEIINHEDAEPTAATHEPFNFDLDNTTSNSMISPGKRLLIFGGVQCIGLSSRLIKSRLNSPYDKYDVCSFVKPNASSEEILKTCKLFNVDQNDFVVLSVGEHDNKGMLDVLCMTYV